jgi:tripartite-type tricarboxylate transporter receptor subunit TctC
MLGKFAKIAALSLLAATGFTTLTAFAQDAYPTKTIRFVVPYPPGGPTDLMARLLQGELQTRLGVSVIIDNKAGAGGNLGSADVAPQTVIPFYWQLADRWR